MITLLKLGYVALMSWFRDFFGKGGYGWPILKYRMVQHIIAFIGTFVVCFFAKGFAWYWCLWVALWIQILFSASHGPMYDLSTAGKPDAKMLKRYEKCVGYKFLCKMFPKDQWYGFGFDFCLLAIRYTWPLLPICWLFNPVFLTLGLVITSLYAIYRYCPFVQKHRLLDVEIWAGFAVGLYVAFL